jgi:ERO1-like protein alpha
MLQSCPLPFDEARLWKGQHGQALKAQLQVAFRNITRIMDCVGCEKCKLWGKLQTLGGLGLPRRAGRFPVFGSGLVAPPA